MKCLRFSSLLLVDLSEKAYNDKGNILNKTIPGIVLLLLLDNIILLISIREYLTWHIPTRVGNSLISFSRYLFVFCEQKSKRAIHLRKRANRSRCSFVMSDLSQSLTVALLLWATWVNHSRLLFCKERGSESLKSLFKIKKSEWAWQMGKLSKHTKNRFFFERIARFLPVFCSITSKSLTSLFCKEWREWFAL